MMKLIYRVIRVWRSSAVPEDLVHHVEDVQERQEDIEHDLYVIKQRTDILHKLVSSMRGKSSVQ